MKPTFQKSILAYLTLVFVVAIIAPSALMLSHKLHGHSKEQGTHHGITLVQKACLDCDLLKMKFSPLLFPPTNIYTSPLKAVTPEISLSFNEGISANQGFILLYGHHPISLKSTTFPMKPFIT